MDLNPIISRVYDGNLNGLRDELYEHYITGMDLPYDNLDDFIEKHGTPEEQTEHFGKVLSA